MIGGVSRGTLTVNTKREESGSLGGGERGNKWNWLGGRNGERIERLARLIRMKRENLLHLKTHYGPEMRY